MQPSSPPNESKAPWESKRKPSVHGVLRRLLTWIIVLGLLGLIGYAMMPKPIAVEAARAARRELNEEIIEEGKTRIRNRYTLAAPASGQMRRITLRPGDEVKAGETVVAAIEPSVAPLLDGRARAQADARVEAASANLQRAKESLEMSRTAAQFAASNWERIKVSSQKGSISINERDNAEREASMRAQEVRAADFALKVSEFELAQAKAALLPLNSPAEAMLEIKSPVSGRVLKVMQESAMVVAAGTALVEIGDERDLEIEAEILSRDAVVIKPGANVLIEQWGGEAPLKGKVRRVEPAAFTKVSALGVEEQRVIVLCDLVSAPPAASSLGDRYRVEVRIATWQGENVLTVPSGALFREGTEWKVYTVSDGKAQKAIVSVGHSDGKFTEIVQGIEPRQQILLHPPDTVHDGVAVKIRER